MTDEGKDQMSLFGALQEPPGKESLKNTVVVVPPDRLPKKVKTEQVATGQPTKPASRSGKRAAVRGGRKKTPKAQAKTYAAGLVPAGDVRLTINIRQDLHLRLKIAAAHERTTIGEIIEELVEQYVPH
ncbi:hypothetical protein [Geobacter argillaceus]|uniref:Plasmid segregation centromere-binding protein ParG n=1 Tax=Geobacter argillaceus TaxID=345631 RepID=A0A562VM37_9BACT|nr:hypothetical protein [Geobacter argillaceus]TWJ18797.1 hypothetical protein JN12_02433 [Geobacter argillaceus]